MTEVEKIAYAKLFIDKLANGIDPLTDRPVPEGDVINQVRISRCLFYVSEILRQVVEQGGTERKKPRPKKTAFWLDEQARAAFRCSDLPLPVSEIARRLNALNQSDSMKKLSYRAITDWLVQAGFLELVTKGDGTVKREPTDLGRQIGITTELRQNEAGTYAVNLYNREAQQFILDNLDAITAPQQG